MRNEFVKKEDSMPHPTAPDTSNRDEFVSVVVPAYNAERHLGEALASALAQTHRHLEVIVVDDGSTDRTPAIVEAIAASDPRVRLVRQTNSGVAAARNRGIEAARGELIATLDADDLWHPEKLARQVAAMRQAGPDVGLIYCWYRDVDEAGRIIRSQHFPPWQGEVYALLVYCNFVGNASTPLFLRSCLKQIGGFDTSLHAQGAQGWEDTQLYLKIAERHDFALVPSFLVGYRQSDNSMSRDTRRMMRSADIVLTEARRRHPELPRRLFRWARGGYRFWLGAGKLWEGRPWEAVPLLLQAMLHDPATVLGPAGRALRARSARFFGFNAADLRLKRMDRENDDVRGQPFTMAPTENPTIVGTTNPPHKRRLAYLAAIRICRPGGGR